MSKLGQCNHISSTDWLVCKLGHKVYGIDKTLLVPLVQSSVDIVQGQVQTLRGITIHQCALLVLSCGSTGSYASHQRTGLKLKVPAHA